MNPYASKPPFKFATVPFGSTEANLQKNYPKMYSYMKKYNKSTVERGIEAVKNAYVMISHSLIISNLAIICFRYLN